MNDVLLLSLGCVVIAILIFALHFLRQKPPNEIQEDIIVQRPRGVPLVRDAAPRRVRRNIQTRMRNAAAAGRQEEEEEERYEENVEESSFMEEVQMPDGKIGAKKRKKLEMKAEKRMQRERELEEREERKQRQLELDEIRAKREAKERAEELKKEAEEKALKEEQEQKELEEYLKLKESFQVEEEGFDEEEPDEQGNKLQEFINYINEQKVVLLEDLASHFKLKTQDAIDRVHTLMEQESLVGVIDDRGKFISISRQELESVAEFMRQRGRVSIAELAESSNSLICLRPETVMAEA